METKEFTITINNRSVTVEEGQTILEAARKLDIWIPTLCQFDSLEPRGACRLCLVEMELEGRKRIVASCSQPAINGMTVQTDSEQVIENRGEPYSVLSEESPAEVPARPACSSPTRKDTPKLRLSVAPRKGK